MPTITIPTFIASLDPPIEGITRREVVAAAQAAGVTLKDGRLPGTLGPHSDLRSDDLRKVALALRTREPSLTVGSVWASNDARDRRSGARQCRVLTHVRLPSIDWRDWERELWPHGVAFLTVGDPRDPRGSVGNRITVSGAIARHRYIRSAL